MRQWAATVGGRAAARGTVAVRSETNEAEPSPADSESEPPRKIYWSMKFNLCSECECVCVCGGELKREESADKTCLDDCQSVHVQFEADLAPHCRFCL